MRASMEPAATTWLVAMSARGRSNDASLRHIHFSFTAHVCVCVCVCVVDEKGLPLVHLVAGREASSHPASADWKDGSVDVARFKAITSLLLCYDTHKQPFVLVSESHVIRVLSGSCVGGIGESRVHTIGGSESLNLARELLSLQRQHDAGRITRKELAADYASKVQGMPTSLQRTLGKLIKSGSGFILHRRNDHQVLVEEISGISTVRSSPMYTFFLLTFADLSQPIATRLDAGNTAFLAIAEPKDDMQWTVLPTMSLLLSQTSVKNIVTKRSIYALSSDGTKVLSKGVTPTLVDIPDPDNNIGMAYPMADGSVFLFRGTKGTFTQVDIIPRYGESTIDETLCLEVARVCSRSHVDLQSVLRFVHAV